MSDARTLAADLTLAAKCLRDAKILLPIGSRNAAYLASQCAEHIVRSVATSEGLHIPRKDAHQLDTIVRRIPNHNANKAALEKIAFLEAYSTAFRYPTLSGRMRLAEDRDFAGRLQAHGCIDRRIGPAVRRRHEIGSVVEAPENLYSSIRYLAYHPDNVARTLARNAARLSVVV